MDFFYFENLKFNLASGHSVEQMIGDLSNLNTTNKTNVVNAVNVCLKINKKIIIKMVILCLICLKKKKILSFYIRYFTISLRVLVNSFCRIFWINSFLISEIFLPVNLSSINSLELISSEVKFTI